MEGPLVAELEEIQRGYDAALFRQSLNVRGILTKRQFEAWLMSEPHHTQAAARDRAKLGALFLAGVPVEQAGRLRDIKIQALLWADSVVLYALKVVLQEERMPSNEILMAHVVAVSEFVA